MRTTCIKNHHSRCLLSSHPLLPFPIHWSESKAAVSVWVPDLLLSTVQRGVMSALHGYLEHQVLAVTQDGRVIVGTLRGVDGVGSVILSGCVERVFSPDAGVEEVPLGLYVVRGDAISLIGDMDTEMDKAQDLTNLRAEPIPETRHY